MRRDPAARAVNREHRVAIDFVEINVFQHGAAPVRQVQEIDARLIGVHAGLDRHAAHRLAAAEEQIQIVAVPAAAFLDDLADGDAQIFPGVFLFDGHVRDQLATWLMPSALRTLLIARRTLDGVSAALPALTRGVASCTGYVARLRLSHVPVVALFW